MNDKPSGNKKEDKGTPLDKKDAKDPWSYTMQDRDAWGNKLPPLGGNKPLKTKKNPNGSALIGGIVVFVILVAAFGSSSGNKQNSQNTNHTIDSPYVESDAMLADGVTSGLVEGVVQEIRRHGYTCDSVSSVTRSITHRNVEVSCNHFAYRFEFQNRGGKWSFNVLD